MAPSTSFTLLMFFLTAVCLCSSLFVIFSDLHTMWQYISQFASVLKVGGRAIIHTANLVTEQGWERFASQSRFKEGGFYFVSPEIINFLVAKTKAFKILKSSSPNDDKENMYYQRDYMVLVEKIN